jgi:predicted nucleotidyltransferase
MIEKSTIQEVLEFFFRNPSKEFHLRELSRLLKLSMPTIISTTNALAKENLIVKSKSSFMTKVQANMENAFFIRKKRLHNLELMYDSGIVDYLMKTYNNPKSMILFGSFSRGDDIESSDIDVAVITNKRINLNLSEYEVFLGRRISIHEIELKKISSEFRSNLMNGIVLEGSW